MQPASYTLSLLKKVQEANGVFTFYFDRSTSPFDFLPGQYMRVIVPDVEGDERGNSRMFSISSSPTQEDIITHTTMITESPFKKKLVSLNVGDQVNFFGPLGRFVLDPDDRSEKVFLAGGIGLTPFHSMIKYVFDKKLDIRLTLIVSFSTIEDCIFINELRDISDKSENINVVYTLSRAESIPADWTGENGRISSEMIEKHVPNFKEVTYFICGSEKVILALEDVILNMGIGSDRINKEHFPGY